MNDPSTVDLKIDRQAQTVAQADTARRPDETMASGVQPSLAGQQPRFFGNYELISEIARGGMGVVYKAHQTKLGRTVALKMILAGHLASKADVERFSLEARAAAQLDHPGIVPIYEIDQLDGQHFFSMAFIEGNSLAARLSDGPLPARQAAAIVRSIAEAVAYAHAHGVVHRDLKPANVLVDEAGHIKVTDFGLAKRTSTDSQLTGTGQILGTPSFMPPEQAEGRHDVGPAADIYSLGAILYCVLTGRPPFHAATVIETLLQVRAREPVSPRALNPQVPRDLETICLKCLSKDPRRRYASADALADDLTRWLDGRPIMARPIGPLERLWRWSRRNPNVAGLAAALLLTIIAGLAGISWQWWKAEQATELALKSAAQTKAVNQFLIDGLLAEAAPERNPVGANITLRQVLDKAAKNADRAFPNQPEVEAALQVTIGNTYLSLGLGNEAEPHLERAVTLSRHLYGSTHPDSLHALDRLATLRQLQGRDSEPEQLFREIILARRNIRPVDVVALSEAINNLATFHAERGRWAEAETGLREAIALLQPIYGIEHKEVLVPMNGLAWILQARGKLDEAEELAQQAVEPTRRLMGAHDPQTLNAMNTLATILQKRGKFEQAEPLFRQVLDTRIAVQGETHRDALIAKNNLAVVLREMERFDECESLLRQNLAAFRDQGFDDITRLFVEGNLGGVLIALGRIDEAQSLFEQNVERRRKLLPADHPDIALGLTGLAESMIANQQAEQAEPKLREALDIYTRTTSLDPARIVHAQSALGECLTALERYEEAEQALLRAHELSRERAGIPRWHQKRLIARLVALYESWGKPEQAERWRS